MIGVALVMLLAAACGEDGSEPNADRPSGHDAEPPVPGRHDEPNELQPNPEAVHARPLRWSRVEEAGEQVLRIHVTLGAPPCSVLATSDVEETPETVTVTLTEGRLPGADCDGPVTPLGVPGVVTVRLAAPLGERRVVDGST